MTSSHMNSMQRVLKTLSHQEPDRVPVFLCVTMHGAKELGLTIEEYFSKAENVAEGQLRMRKKYDHDCLCPFFYGSIEIEAWGGEVVFHDDGPPNSGLPFIKSLNNIKGLQPPRVMECRRLLEVLKTLALLKERVGDEVPLIGVVMSPFSVPVMQMGFDNYIELIYEHHGLFEQLMRVNEEFCVEWANAQLAAGATAICYFDPVSSPTIIPRDLYLKTGFPIANSTLSRIKGPTATHFASGICLPILSDVVATGTAIVSASVTEDLAETKAACKGKLTVLGNLNGIEMRRWTVQHAEKMVKDAIAKAGAGGGFILSDNHGEIPWQVPDEVLIAISDAVYKWGQYPLNWINDYAG